MSFLATHGALGAIGQTKLVRLRWLSERTGCEILAKAEFTNPGQSIKDRAALALIEGALSRGELAPGGTVVEGTAGNTGIGLALVGHALGLRTVIVMPETQSDEKKQTLRALGAELVLVPAVPYKNPNNYVHVSQRLAEQLRARGESAFWANQFDNVDNLRAHYEGTGQEIWQQTAGKVHGFVCAVGSGGTLAGVAKALREHAPTVHIALADPPGAALYSYYTEGCLSSSGSSITEGIGQGRITKNLEGLRVDHAFLVDDADSVAMTFELLEREGLCVGGSSGVNVVGAVRLAERLGPGHTVVTVLPDTGARYTSKLFSPDFLRSKGLDVPKWLTPRAQPLQVPWV